MRSRLLFRVVAAASALGPLVAAAQTPVGYSFTYQGMLRTGAAPANGTYDFQFRLFDASSGGAAVGPWVCIDNKPVADGLIAADLVFGSVFDGSARWLEIGVRADATPGNCLLGGGPYTTLTPRQRITSTPYAQFAQAPWATSPAGDIYFGGANVGIGTATPSNRLTVANEEDANAIVAIDSGDMAAQASILHFKDRGTAVWAVLKNAANRFAIREVGPGVDRLVVDTGGKVGIGTSDPDAHLHVVGGTVPSFPAIRGYSPNTGQGVVGEGAAFGTGVLGIAPSSGWAVDAIGNMGASGLKAFRIDHPLDPDEHYLSHYCTEGPEPLNVYSGNAVLGAAGEAVVSLPAYFSSINRDVRYQLTCIGGHAPVYVAQEVAPGANAFVIGGGRPGLKISWRVEATRNDAWVRAYGAPVEEAKPADRRGTYLHPELYGQSEAKGEFARVRGQP